MGPRTNLAATLAIAGLTLLVAIYIGNQMGNHVLGQATERGPAIAATPVATPVPADSGGPGALDWKHEQVISVATDPAFPDPRVTPEAPPPPPVRTPTPRPTLTPTPAPTVSPSVPYTSPPLPIPLVTESPQAAASADAGSATPIATSNSSAP